jgi:hypothetical protein
MHGHSHDRTSLKEFGAVLKPATQTPFLIDEFEQQVGPRDAEVRINERTVHGGPGVAKMSLQNEHHPKQGIAIQARARRVPANFLDRQFLVS